MRQQVAHHFSTVSLEPSGLTFLCDPTMCLTMAKDESWALDKREQGSHTIMGEGALSLYDEAVDRADRDDKGKSKGLHR